MPQLPSDLAIVAPHPPSPPSSISPATGLPYALPIFSLLHLSSNGHPSTSLWCLSSVELQAAEVRELVKHDQHVWLRTGRRTDILDWSHPCSPAPAPALGPASIGTVTLPSRLNRRRDVTMKPNQGEQDFSFFSV
jgi:hypothetical protein